MTITKTHLRRGEVDLSIIPILVFFVLYISSIFCWEDLFFNKMPQNHNCHNPVANEIAKFIVAAVVSVFTWPFVPFVWLYVNGYVSGGWLAVIILFTFTFALACGDGGGSGGGSGEDVYNSQGERIGSLRK